VMGIRTVLLFGLALWLGSGLAAAHQQRVAITDIEINDAAGTIDVVHSFILHDAEAALAEAKGVRTDMMTNSAARDAFAAYVAGQFALAGTEPRTTLNLTLIGSEIEDGRVWVYQQTAIPSRDDTLVVSQGALRDIWPDQVNTVNVRRRGQVDTLTFTDRDGAQIVNFSAPGP